MDLKLPEETLIRVGFKYLDILYGKLTIKKGMRYDEIFIDKYGKGRLGYDKPRLEKTSALTYLFEDRIDFLSMIPVDVDDFERVLGLWMEEYYNRRSGIITSWRIYNFATL